MKKYLYTLIFIVLHSCSSDEKISPNDDFDRGLILTSTYDNIIIPAYVNLDITLKDLEEKIDYFNEDPNTDNLSALRQSWISSYTAWQSVAMFNIRKAEEIFYADIMNTYPCDEDIINNNINDSVYEIPGISINNLGSSGFPAIGYLIYGLSEDSTNILSFYTSNNADKYKTYLQALINNMIYNTELVITDWNNHRSDFVNSTGNSSTSSLNTTINDVLQYFEKRVREAKVAIPSAVRGDLTPRPDQVESYYHADICKILLQNAFTSIERFYYGHSYFGLANGTGLETYLQALDNTEELRDAITSQIEDIKQKILLLDNNFIIQLENNPQKMWDVFYSMQTLVTYTKSDMLSKFNISSDYMDNDGD